MIMTIAGRTNLEMMEEAAEIAEQLQIPFFPRQKRSIHMIQQEVHDDCLVVGKNRLELYPFGEKEPCFFHPNSAMFRIKRLQNGESDPFVDAAKLSSGKTLLDCTFGLGSDSITAKLFVGEQGSIMGCEGNRFLAYLMKRGLHTWNDGAPAILAAMRRIELTTSLALGFSKNLTC